MEDCIKWSKNPKYNPKTGARISPHIPNGLYSQYKEKCAEQHNIYPEENIQVTRKALETSPVVTAPAQQRELKKIAQFEEDEILQKLGKQQAQEQDIDRLKQIYQTRINQLEKQLRQNSDLDQLHRIKSDLEKRKKILEQVSNQDRELRELKQTLEELKEVQKQERDRLRKQVEDCRRRLTETEAEKKLIRKVSNLETEINRLRRENSAVNKQLEELQETHKQATQELEKKIQNRNEQIKRLSTSDRQLKLTQVQKEMENYKNQIERYREEHDQCESKLAELEAVNSGLQVVVSDQEKTIQRLKKENRELRESAGSSLSLNLSAVRLCHELMKPDKLSGPKKPREDELIRITYQVVNQILFEEAGEIELECSNYILDELFSSYLETSTGYNARKHILNFIRPVEVDDESRTYLFAIYRLGQLYNARRKEKDCLVQMLGKVIDRYQATDNYTPYIQETLDNLVKNIGGGEGWFFDSDMSPLEDLWRYLNTGSIYRLGWLRGK